MGNLISSKMLVDLLINIINIAILFFVTKKLVYKPVKKILSDRKEKTMAAADKARCEEAEAKETKESYLKKLSEMENASSSAVKEARRQAVSSAEKIINDAKNTADNIISQAKYEAETEKEKTLSSVHGDIVDMAVDIAEKLIGRNITDADNERIINDFFGKQGGGDE